MVTNIVQQKSAQSLVLVPVEAYLIERQASSADEAYFTSLLDTGDEIVDPAAGAPAPVAPVAAPSMAAYLVGLLDDGDE
jgi:hypothetical protein